MKCQLGKTDITIFGTEFTPVLLEKGKLAKNHGLHRRIGERKEGVYVDCDGNKIKKSKILKLKSI